MLFDVRFVVDSIVERVIRAIHLGVMVGVSVVAPQYNPADQIKGTFQAFSVILCISRLVLAIQYGLTIFREPVADKKTRLGLQIMVGTHLVAALVYMGITFRFTDSKDSRVFVTWYIMGFVETVLIFAVSTYFDKLGFRRSALPERMKTVTLLILGEGVIVVADHVGKVVENHGSWTSATVGVLTATVSLIYLIFQIYFDWAWPAMALTEKFQHTEGFFLYSWSLLHVPFHLCLVLLMEGAAQFVVWWKIVEKMQFVSAEFFNTWDRAVNHPAAGTSHNISGELALRLNETVYDIWRFYKPDLFVTIHHVDGLIRNLSQTPDDFWTPDRPGHSHYDTFTDALKALKVTVYNSILQNFGIEEINDDGWRDDPATYEEHAFEEASNRFKLVYIYVFCVAGGALILMGLLNIFSRPNHPGLRRTVFQRIVVAINIALGCGLMLLSTMATGDARQRFDTSPWINPVMVLIFFVALVLVHMTRSYGLPDESKPGGKGAVTVVKESAEDMGTN